MTLILIAYKNLLLNFRRTAIILLTIASGTGALFLYHGFNTGILNQYKYNTIHSRYGHGQINTHGYLEQNFEKPWEHWIQNPDQLISTLSKESFIENLFPRVEFFAMLNKGELSIAGRGQGVDAKKEETFFTALNFVEGKNLSGETAGTVMGIGLAKSLKAHVGDQVTVLTNTVYGSMNGIDLTVVGIFQTGVKEFDDMGFRFDIKEAQQLLDTDRIETIAVGLKQDNDWRSFQNKMLMNYPEFETTPFAKLDEVYYQHAVDFLKAQFDTIKVIILFVVTLGIFSIIATNILERKEEIGNLRANGESKWDITKGLLLEGALVGFLGTILGLLIALVLNNTLLMGGILMPPSPGITKSFRVMVELQPSYALLVLLLGTLMSTIATYIASIRTLKEEITTLLRSR